MLQIETDTLAKAAEFLKADKLVALPTETVYGLAGNALSDNAVAAIYAAKGRPDFNPLIIHVATIDDAKKYTVWNDTAEKLAQKYWPGPLTLILPRKPDCTISLLASAGLHTIAIRVPAHPIAQQLLQITQLPLAAPSANRSGRISPTLASHVAEELGDKVAMILDGGACSVGIESTIVDVKGTPTILRHGTITTDELKKLIPLAEANSQGKILAPGMLESHYAPTAKLRINACELSEGELLLAFGKTFAPTRYNLSESANLQEAAANLFRMMREMDAASPNAIAVMPIPHEGLGIAINDRLQRAAAPR